MHLHAQFVDLAAHRVLQVVVPDADEVLVGDSGQADRSGIEDGFVRQLAHRDRHVGRHVRLCVLSVVDAELQVVPAEHNPWGWNTFVNDQ